MRRPIAIERRGPPTGRAEQPGAAPPLDAVGASLLTHCAGMYSVGTQYRVKVHALTVEADEDRAEVGTYVRP